MHRLTTLGLVAGLLVAVQADAYPTFGECTAWCDSYGPCQSVLYDKISGECHYWLCVIDKPGRPIPPTFQPYDKPGAFMYCPDHVPLPEPATGTSSTSSSSTVSSTTSSPSSSSYTSSSSTSGPYFPPNSTTGSHSPTKTKTESSSMTHTGTHEGSSTTSSPTGSETPPPEGGSSSTTSAPGGGGGGGGSPPVRPSTTTSGGSAPAQTSAAIQTAMGANFGPGAGSWAGAVVAGFAAMVLV